MCVCVCSSVCVERGREVVCVIFYLHLPIAVSMANLFFFTNTNDIRKLLDDDNSKILYQDSDEPQVCEWVCDVCEGVGVWFNILSPNSLIFQIGPRFQLVQRSAKSLLDKLTGRHNKSWRSGWRRKRRQRNRKLQKQFWLTEKFVENLHSKFWPIPGKICVSNIFFYRW